MYRARLTKGYDEKTAAFLSSISDDEKIIECDINGTEAHDIMLFENKIINRNDLRKILTSLEKIRMEWKQGKLKTSSRYEDIHEFLESRVVKEVGISSGGKLHTARSRNDQVAVDFRMSLREEVNEVSEKILKLAETMRQRAEENKDVVMVLYTHTQHAQIGTMGHCLLAYCDMLLRDIQRIYDAYKRLNLNPLGAVAIAGTSFKIDRERTAALLGFDGLVENSIDAVSSRDFALEIAAVLAILMSNISRITEDIILWSSSEFGYIELADEYASPSSVMPQKKNPCTVELIRGSTGGAYGSLVNLLTVVKGLITGYTRDLQTVKPPLWKSLNIVKDSIDILTGVIETIKINRKHMYNAAEQSYALAVDLAEALVNEHDLSFREAHKVVGSVVKKAHSNGLGISRIHAKTIQDIAKKSLGRTIELDDEFVARSLNPNVSLLNRMSKGSPSPVEISRMIEERGKIIKKLKKQLLDRIRKLEYAQNMLKDVVRSIIP